MHSAMDARRGDSVLRCDFPRAPLSEQHGRRKVRVHGAEEKPPALSQLHARGSASGARTLVLERSAARGALPRGVARELPHARSPCVIAPRHAVVWIERPERFEHSDLRFLPEILALQIPRSPREARSRASGDRRVAHSRTGMMTAR